MNEFNSTLISLMSGALIAGYLVAALFFFKFWRASRDPLFAYFAAALALLAAHRLLLALSAAGVEEQTRFYVLRLLGYLLLLAGVLHKNLRGRRAGPPPGGLRP